MTTPIDTYSEEYRLDCLAKFWISRPRANATKWLEVQARKKPVFAAVMREKMNAEKQKRREARTTPSATKRIAAANDAERDACDTPTAPGSQTLLGEMLQGFR